MENDIPKPQVDNIPETVKRVENEFESSPDISEINIQPGNDLNKSVTEHKIESVKRDLDKIFHSVDEKYKISKKDIQGGSVVKVKNIAIKGEQTGDKDAAQNILQGITKTVKEVKEVKEKCKSAVDKLTLMF